MDKIAFLELLETMVKSNQKSLERFKKRENKSMEQWAEGRISAFEDVIRVIEIEIRTDVNAVLKEECKKID